MVYPSVRYHRHKEPRIIHRPEEEHPDWKDTPAAFNEPEPVLIDEDGEPDKRRGRPRKAQP